jgi:hypothetical protein
VVTGYLHTPPKQTLFGPQGVPSDAMPVTEHVCTPVAQDVTPIWQTFPPGLHAPPAKHARHAPLLHTALLPHTVPSGALAVTTHTAAPVEQEVAPTWQAFPGGLHTAPAAQLTQAPLLQTWLVPQAVPSGRFPVGVHVDVPPEHDVTPA